MSELMPVVGGEADRLFDLLPAVHRTRDEEAGHPLRDLLRVIAEQVELLEQDLEGLYVNWFVESSDEWVVPYLGERVGYEPVADAGDPSSASPELARALVPRQEVANLVRALRRKGTLALLEELGRDVAGWPARAVEYARLLAVMADPDFPHPDRGRTADLHDADALELLDGPFDRLAHTIDVRRPGSHRSPGRYGIDSVVLWVWRTRIRHLVSSPAACLEEVSPSSFTFSVLGNDAPIFRRVVPEADATTIAGEANLPVSLRRRSLADDPSAFYGPGRTFDLEVGVRRGSGIAREPVPIERLVAADLSDWAYRPRPGTVAVDPQLGRVAFPPGQAPHGLWVEYRYGASADIGGGPYPRRLAAPAPGTFHQTVTRTKPYPAGSVRSIGKALDRWEKVREKSPTCVIEILDNEVYAETLLVSVLRGESVEIRAAQRARPVIHLLDRSRNAADAFVITTEPDPEPEDDPKTGDKSGEHGEEQPPPEDHRGGCVRLDGLLVMGRAVRVEGPLQRVEIVDCTLVPGWGLRPDCDPARPSEPSLELYSCRGPVRVTRSILGSIQVYADEVTSDPVEVTLCDSVLDATSDAREAVGAPNWPLAHASLVFSDCTVIGQVQTHAITLAENTIFTGRVRVARRQIGCVRYSYVPPGSRTPRRHRCQPDLAEAAAMAAAQADGLGPVEREERVKLARQLVVPVFESTRYGTPSYPRLGPTCPAEIVRGADDESEMGALHDLYEPQRLANLRARLEQYTPARSDTAVLVADLAAYDSWHRPGGHAGGH
jgi:hypothetical protein